jgi:hypothetical protein
MDSHTMPTVAERARMRKPGDVSSVRDLWKFKSHFAVGVVCFLAGAAAGRLTAAAGAPPVQAPPPASRDDTTLRSPTDKSARAAQNLTSEHNASRTSTEPTNLREKAQSAAATSQSVTRSPDAGATTQEPTKAPAPDDAAREKGTAQDDAK